MFDFLQGALRINNIWNIGTTEDAFVTIQPMINLYIICFVISDFLQTEMHASQIRVIKK